MSNIKVGLGDPSKPSLTAEEEKRVDADHQPVVTGLAWSDAGTGLYLTVFSSRGSLLTARNLICGQSLYLDGQLALTVGTSLGRPTFGVAGYGASLELPVDLGLDELKQRYVMDWLIDTAQEALVAQGFQGLADPQKTQELGTWLFVTANDAINSARL